MTHAGEYWETHATTWRTFHRVRGLRPGALVAGFLSSREAALAERLATCAGTETLLDIGCGSGETLAAARSRVGRAVGVDRSRALLTLARGAGHLVQADAHQLPFRDGCGHVVLAAGLMDYVQDPPQVLAELARLTAPGGRVLLTYPQRPSPFGWLRQGWGARLRWLLFRLPPVRNAMTWEELSQALAATGLTPAHRRSLWRASWFVEAVRRA